MAALRAMSHPEDMPTDCGGKSSVLQALLLRAHRSHKPDSSRLGPTTASQLLQGEREEDTDEETSGAGYGQVQAEAMPGVTLGRHRQVQHLDSRQIPRLDQSRLLELLGEERDQRLLHLHLSSEPCQLDPDLRHLREGHAEV